MEAGSKTGEGGGAKVWIHSHAWSSTGMSLDEEREKTEQLLDHAAELGFTRIDGAVSLSRERDPIETFSYGSDVPFKNRLARTGYDSVAGTIASGAGARTPA